MNMKEVKDLIQEILQSDISEFELEHTGTKVKLKRGMKSPEVTATSGPRPAWRRPTILVGPSGAFAPGHQAGGRFRRWPPCHYVPHRGDFFSRAVTGSGALCQSRRHGGGRFHTVRSRGYETHERDSCGYLG